ncbi:MAG: AgmX/PglI C-terminal domain-containing protein [Chitinivibrionales bacterium]|nr:AgmX/PglI C-terminal domain-containing protein [Chitinivibrionales bacterium]
MTMLSPNSAFAVAVGCGGLPDDDEEAPGRLLNRAEFLAPDEPDLELKPKTGRTVRFMIEIQTTTAGPLAGGRNRAGINRVVRRNMMALRFAYNKRLKARPGLRGKITVKFAINEFGKIIFCDVLCSTVNDAALEEQVAAVLGRWRFDKIDLVGDVMTVVYPFAFTN